MLFIIFEVQVGYLIKNNFINLLSDPVNTSKLLNKKIRILDFNRAGFVKYINKHNLQLSVYQLNLIEQIYNIDKAVMETNSRLDSI